LGKNNVNDGRQKVLMWSAPFSLDQRKIAVQAEAIMLAVVKTYLSYSDVAASGSRIAHIHASYSRL
jgi:hypothetical protein